MQDSGGAPAPVRPPNIIALGPELLIRGTVIPSFAQFAVQGEDNLRIVLAFTQSASVVVAVQGRFLDALSGKVLPFEFSIALFGQTTPLTSDFALGTGYLLNLTAFVSSAGAVQIGQVYAVVEMIRGLGGATFLLATLVGGYITNGATLGWPGSPIKTSIEGQGFLTTTAPNTPPAGSDISLQAPSGIRWHIKAAVFVLTTSAVVGNRTIVFVVTRGGNSGFQMPAPVVQPASTTTIYILCPAAAFTGPVNQRELMPLPPDLIMAPTDALSTVTGGIDVADQWTMHADVEQWLVL